MNRNFTIAGVQMWVHENDLQKNLKSMEDSVAFIAANYPFVDMIVFSELCMFGAPYPGWKRDAEPIPGPMTERFCSLAEKHGKWLVPGSQYEKANGKIYNTSLAISPAGEIVARYRKMFPWQPLEQTEPGGDFCVFDVPDVGRFGLCICYDMWFPEVCRTLAWMGAEVIIHPTMTSTNDREQELILSRANAIFNQFYFIDVNGSGFGGNGRSLMADPHGRLLQSAGNEPLTMIETIDLKRVRETREYGTAGVSQVLKQFVATAVNYPVYGGDLAKGAGFMHLGAVSTPKRGNNDNKNLKEEE